MNARRRLGNARLLGPLDLEILVGVAAGRTQADIGAELRLEQPAVSKHLRAVERKLGVPLVRQEGRRLLLTGAGRDLAAAAEALLERFDDLDALVASWRDGTAGAVRVIASSTPGSYVMPLVVGDFLERYPGARVDLDVRPLVQLWDIFQGGAYDFAVVPRVTFPVPVATRTLYEDRVVLFASPAHRLAGRASVTTADLADETIIGKFAEGYWGDVFDRPEHRGLRRTRHIEMVSLEAIKRLAERQVGIGALFESAVRQELADGKFCWLPLPLVEVSETFCLAQRERVSKSPMVAQFETFVHDWFAHTETFAASQ